MFVWMNTQKALSILLSVLKSQLLDEVLSTNEKTAVTIFVIAQVTSWL